MLRGHDGSRRDQRLRSHRPQLLPGGEEVRGRHRLRGRQRPRLGRDDGPPAPVRLGDGSLPRARSSVVGRRHRRRRRHHQDPRRARPEGPAVGRPRRRRGGRVDRLLHRPRQGRRPPRRRRAARHRVGSRHQRRRHLRGRRQRRHLRPREAQGRVERLVHDELLRARWSRCSTTPSASRRA